MKTIKPQVVFMKEESPAPELQEMQEFEVPSESENAILSARIEAMENRILKRIRDLESIILKQNDKISQIIAVISKGDSQQEQTESIPEMAEEWICSMEESEVPAKRPRISDPIVVEFVEEEFVEDDFSAFEVIEDRMETPKKPEATPRTSRVLPKISEMPNFPIRDINVLRGFNKSLGRDHKLFQQFLQLIQTIVDGVETEWMPSTIFTQTLSENILQNCTWAARSPGKIMLTSLPNFMKVVLEALKLYDVKVASLRSRTMEMLGRLRVKEM